VINDAHAIGMMSWISPPPELRVVKLCYDLLEAGADRGRSAHERFYFAVGGDEFLKFMRDAVLRPSIERHAQNVPTCEPLRGHDFEG